MYFFRLQRVISHVLFSSVLFFTTASMCLYSSAQSLNAVNVAPDLYRALLQGSPGDHFHVIISLKRQLDLRPWQTAELRSAEMKDRHVASLIEALQNETRHGQPRLLDWMNSDNRVLAGSAKGYWIANIIELQADASFLSELSQHPDVDWMEHFPKNAFEAAPVPPTPAAPVPGGVEPGLNIINARAMWRLGYTGYGRKVLVIDSGQEYDHPALRTQFAYNYGTQGSTYRSSIIGDRCGEHGTAVAGIVLGLDRLTKDTLGPAFNALWMGGPAPFIDPNSQEVCLLPGIQTNSVAVLQWALNPDENPNTSNDLPDVINNSWGTQPSEEGCRSIFRSIILSLDAAGIAVVYSAGNRGPNPSTASLPGGLNMDLVVPFAVGSINGYNNTYPISDFSSRGPSICGRDGSLLIKPEVVAPGERVRTTATFGGYSTVDGTSFAAPLVSGAILLLKEAFPNANGKQLALALYNSARDLGSAGEDNDYGRGLIDVGAAYNWMIAQGFQPTPPVRASNDVIHVQSMPRIFNCDRKLYMEVSFENSGVDTLRSLEIAIRREGQSANLTLAKWIGKLAPGKITTYFVPPFDAPTGRYAVEVDLRNPNGFADARSLNNRMKSLINVTSQEQFPDASVAVNSVCAGSKALVSSNYQGEGTVRWFNQNTGGTPLSTGNNFATGILTKDTFLFAELTFNSNTGLVNQTGAEVVYSDSVGGLVFDAYYPFLLKSVTIYPNRTGLRFFTLRRQDGQVRTISYRVARVGEQKVPLNILVTPGENQVLELTRGGELSILKSKLTYPMFIPDVLAIKSANNTDENEDYPYFFNWEIEYGHPCGRTAVFIDVNPSGNRPQAQFAAPTGSLNTNVALSFQDQSTGATSVRWNFGNGQISTERNPSTIFTKAGSYLVSLSATNADGCSDVFVRSIQIGGVSSTPEQDALSYRFSIFPNPVQDMLNIDYDLGQSRQVKLSIVNAIGQVLQSQKPGKRQAGRETISLQNLATGMYWLIFEADGVKVAKPINKL